MTSPPSSGRQHLDRLLSDPVGFAAFTRTVHAAHRLARGLPAEELFQETARRVLASADQFHGTTREQLLAWVRVIARRVALDALRSRHPNATLPDELSDTADPPPARAERADELQRVTRLLARLSPQDRALLLARVRDGMGPQQIARVVGLSGEAVRQRLSRLLRELRAGAGV
jgi:RNA polymerase sigma-70 factor, ECF subfamily